MLNTLTSINCEMKSMAVYSALAAMVIQFKAESKEVSFSTASWEFENQLISGAMTSEQIIYDLYDSR
jgi:hypothetical protein